MKLKFDVSPKEYQIISDILIKYLPKDVQVFVFGSRAKNQTKFNSDLDLAIKSKIKIDQKTIYNLKEDLIDAPIAYKIDILDLNDIDEDFKKTIEPDFVEFFK